MTRAEARNRIFAARQHIRQAEDFAQDIAGAFGLDPGDDALVDVIWNGGDIASFLDTHCAKASA